MGSEMCIRDSGSAAWNTTGAKPFSKDFKAIVAKAKKKGIRLKYAFMNLDTFSLMAQTEEVVNFPLRSRLTP